MEGPRKSDIAALAICGGLFVAANAVLFIVGRFPLRPAGLPDWSQTLLIITGVAMTLAIFSFLYKDNPFFRAAENLFVGLGLGVSLHVEWYDFVKPHVYDVLVAPMFDPTVDVQSHELLRLVPIMMGVLIVMRMSRNYGWVSRYPLAMMVGFWSGFAIQPSIHSNILRHVSATIVPTPMSLASWACVVAVAALFCTTAHYAPKGGRLGFALKIASGAAIVVYVILRAVPALQARPQWAEAFASVDRTIIMVGVLAVLFYFFFSIEHKGAAGAISRIGIIFLMVAFGASFGYTVMARESLVIGRFQFLLGDWLGLL